MCPDIKIAVMFKCNLRTPTFPKWVIGEGGNMPLHYWQLHSQLYALPTSLININLMSKGVVIKLVCLGEGGENKPKIITIVSWGKCPNE